MDSFSTWALSVGWISLIRDKDKAVSVAMGVPGYPLSLSENKSDIFILCHNK